MLIQCCESTGFISDARDVQLFSFVVSIVSQNKSYLFGYKRGYPFSRMTTNKSVVWSFAIVRVLHFLNNPKDLNPSSKTNLDFWDCFGRKGKKICLITEEIWQWTMNSWYILNLFFRYVRFLYLPYWPIHFSSFLSMLRRRLRSYILQCERFFFILTDLFHGHIDTAGVLK